MAKKTIPCRVCGKQFEPCAFCQKNGDTFRWRNFACSLECANKYITKAVAYNEKMRNKTADVIEEIQPVVEENVEAVEKVVAETTGEIAIETIVETKSKGALVDEVTKKMKKRNYKN